jgi:hypothetical protein
MEARWRSSPAQWQVRFLTWTEMKKSLFKSMGDKDVHIRNIEL